MKRLVVIVMALGAVYTAQAQNVGIGTATPSEKLHVQGGARITNLSGVGYRIVSASATGVLNIIADGLPGQVLTTNGAGGYSWTTASAPGVDNGLYFNAGANSIRMGGPLVENTTVTQGGFGMTWNLNGTGDFQVQDNGATRFIVYDDGRVEMPWTNDASGTANSGVLEIANSLRLDGNEMITNTNTPLYLQNDNNGDLIVDAGTFNVDASINVIGLTAMPAAPYILGAGIPVHTCAYPIEIGSDGNAGQQIGIGYYRGSDPEMNPEQTGGWGYVGYNVAAAGEYWWRMYSGGFITASTRDIKRNIHTVNQDQGMEAYLMNTILNMKPSVYNYLNEYDEMKPGLENHYRPAFRMGLIVDETPDFLLDEGFGGVDIYGVASLSLAGVQHNMKEIEKLKQTRTVQDFGSEAMTGTEVWVDFTEDFGGKIPVVTITSNDPSVTISVIEKSPAGFKAVVSEAASGLQFDWIAMAKVATTGSEATNLSPELKDKFQLPAETKQEIIEFYKDFNSTIEPAKRQ